MAGGGGFQKGLVGEVLKIWKAEVLMPAFVPFSKKDLQILFWGSDMCPRLHFFLATWQGMTNNLVFQIYEFIPLRLCSGMLCHLAFGYILDGLWEPRSLLSVGEYLIILAR